MPDFDFTGELSLKIELHMLRPITENVHSGNGPVSLVAWPCITRQSLCRKGPFIISTGGGGAVEDGVGHDFFDKLKWGRKFFVVFLVLKSGFYVPNHVFLNDLVWVWALLSNFKRKWVMKLRIMIPGATWMARGVIRLVHGHTKSTLITYFSGMKIDPKYAFLNAFFLICPLCPFQNLSTWPKTQPFFPILHVFAPLNDVRAYSAWSWKTTLITWIFGRAWYPPWHSSGPPGIMIYHVPTKYKIFLSKGVLSPCNHRQGASSLDPCTSLTECPSHNSKFNDAHA